MKIGVLGGTFDPVHNGHLLIAEEARNQLELDRVIFIPAGYPYFRSEKITPAKHRVEMVRLAILGCAYFTLETMEMERAGPSYTVDTVAVLKSRLAANDEIIFIMGVDSLVQLPRWHDAPRLIKLCRIAAVPRPGCATPDIKALEEKLTGISQRAILMNGPLVDISSTDIRSRVAGGEPIEQLVPKNVVDYIKQQGFYKRPEEV